MKKVRGYFKLSRNTDIYHEEEVMFGAPHHFKINDKNGNIIQGIDFQKGPIKENGINGISNEDILVLVLTRLKGFQGTKFSCRENAIAITKIEETLMWLEKRTLDRLSRDVEGTSNK